MGDFSDSPKWTLVNDFTIHEDRNHGDRPYMLTRVPQILDVEVTSFEIIRCIEWPDSHDDENRPATYADKSYIRFNGEFHDRIIVFNMSDGEIASFQALRDARIRPIPQGTIGGKHKATSLDGIRYSGMSSQIVPNDGLMVGEPSSLSFLSEYEEPNGEKTEAYLSAQLYLDEDKLFKLIKAISENSRPVETFKVHILAELFESEVSASLSEPWMSHDYGLLMKGEALALTRARIDAIRFSTGTTEIATNLDMDENETSKTVQSVKIEQPKST